MVRQFQIPIPWTVQGSDIGGSRSLSAVHAGLRTFSYNFGCGSGTRSIRIVHRSECGGSGGKWNTMRLAAVERGLGLRGIAQMLWLLMQVRGEKLSCSGDPYEYS